MKKKRVFSAEQPFCSVNKVLEVHHEKIINDEDDRVVIITGDTGSGKSNFAKHLFDRWYTNILKEKPSKDLLSFFCFGTKDWSEALHNIHKKNLKCRMLYNDEAINILYYRDSTTKGSKLIKKNFNIIRYLNIYHILTIPNAHELDPEVVRNRVCGMWYLHKYNGKRVASYFNQEGLLKVISELKDIVSQKAYTRNQIPKVTDTKAFSNRVFYVYPSLYKGWLNDSYMDNKHDQAKYAIDELYSYYNNSKVSKIHGKDYYIDMTKKTLDLISAGKTIIDACTDVGISKDTFRKYRKQLEAVKGEGDTSKEGSSI